MPPLSRFRALRVVVVAQPVVIEEAIRIMQPGGPQHLHAADPLMLEVVDGEAGPRVVMPSCLVDLVQQHRYQGRLPVVAMDDVRMLAGLPQELHRRPGEEGEAQDVVRKAVDAAPVEEVVPRMRLDEETFASVHETEIDGAVDGPVVPGHPQVLEDLDAVHRRGRSADCHTWAV